MQITKTGIAIIAVAIIVALYIVIAIIKYLYAGRSEEVVIDIKPDDVGIIIE